MENPENQQGGSLSLLSLSQLPNLRFFSIHMPGIWAYSTYSIPVFAFLSELKNSLKKNPSPTPGNERVEGGQGLIVDSRVSGPFFQPKKIIDSDEESTEEEPDVKGLSTKFAELDNRQKQVNNFFRDICPLNYFSLTFMSA